MGARVRSNGGTRRIAILGASGYTGVELVRLLLSHPQVELGLLTADSQAGKRLGEIYPHLAGENLPRLVPLADADYRDIDLVFACLPHGTTQEVIAALPERLRVVDLSADFRLSDPALYAEWYGHPHRAKDLQKRAVYGLTEWHREAIAKARLVANPGCYPTSAELPLIPLLREGLIEVGGIVIDSKSGVTGAGRSLRPGMLFAEANEGVSAYGVAGHRHRPEIEQELSRAAGVAVEVSFTPHLIPMNRGILSTIYVTLGRGKSAKDLRSCLKRAYAKELFVRVAPEGLAPSTQSVRGTNLCAIGIFEGRSKSQAVLVSALDNLVKGASGQAVQNMNVMYGFPETTALEARAAFP